MSPGQVKETTLMQSYQDSCTDKTSTMNTSIVMLTRKTEAHKSSTLDKEVQATRKILPIGYLKPSGQP